MHSGQRLQASTNPPFDRLCQKDGLNRSRSAGEGDSETEAGQDL
jgi:hypothetical protein